MDDAQQPEDISIRPEEVSGIVKDIVDQVIGSQAYYDHVKAGHWINSIVELSMKKLVGLNKPFKFVVTCIVMQKTGAGLHAASSALWDVASDNVVMHREESHKTMYCITTIHWVVL
eukprot:TRINITY_DN16683_c0_g1_i1.p1 TRINITY_DN16683_c0_g1~~TRINITY_DN16683_c0_g1_i1.p1  ORF type:complete len:116 (+),score=18.75 TRINITY_DN16683_c0_g1_i1:33-380(+)